MNRVLGVVLVVLLLAVVTIAVMRPDLFPAGLDIPQMVWLVMALLLVSGAGWGFARFRYDGGTALAGILFWAALIVAITFAYSWFN
jgi:hypothetical protein